MKDKIITIKSAELKVRIPSVPNFILTDDASVKISIASLSYDQLIEIAEHWKKNLITRAKELKEAK